MKIKKITRA